MDSTDVFIILYTSQNKRINDLIIPTAYYSRWYCIVLIRHSMNTVAMLQHYRPRYQRNSHVTYMRNSHDN